MDDRPRIRILDKAALEALGDRYGFFHSPILAVPGDLRLQNHPSAACLAISLGENEQGRPYDHQRAGIMLGLLAEICVLSMAPSQKRDKGGRRECVLVPNRPIWSNVDDARATWYHDPARLGQEDLFLAQTFVAWLDQVEIPENGIEAFAADWSVIGPLLPRFYAISKRHGVIDFVLCFPQIPLSIAVTEGGLYVCSIDHNITMALRDIELFLKGTTLKCARGRTISSQVHKDDR